MANTKGPFDGELAFMKEYKKYQHQATAIREAACLRVLYKDYFTPILRGDLLAGRVSYPAVGYGTENTTGGFILYCHTDRIKEKLKEANVTPEYKDKVMEMCDYFQDKVFFDSENPETKGRMPEALPDEVLKATKNTVADMDGRLAGSCINYDKLIRLGINGLKEEIRYYQEKNALTPQGKNYGAGSPHSAKLYEGMLMALDNLSEVCLMYSKQAWEMAESLPSSGNIYDVKDSNISNANPLTIKDHDANATNEKLNSINTDKGKLRFTGGIYADGSINVGTHIEDYTDNIKWKAELIEMAKCLENIAHNRPSNLREALQLAWLYTLAAMTVNYGRMDVYAGDLYCQDIDQGVLTEEKALKLVQSFWRLTVARRICAMETAEFNARVVIGGKGRRNVENADRFALVAMEASRTVVETEPQLTLRVYEGMNPKLMKKALDVIGQGRIYPMLYNDDVNIPAIAQAFGVSQELATKYYPYGCGEYAIEHTSIGSPNCSLNTLKCLEIVLHRGVDIDTGKQIGFDFGPLSTFDSFYKLLNAYKKQLEYFALNLGKRHVIEYQVEAEMATFPLISALYDDCLEKGRSIVDRGARYTGSIIESFGLVNTADSLLAIKKAVYDMDFFTLEELVQGLDANFQGYERMHKILRSLPKYGNDIDEADQMLNHICNHLADYCKYNAPVLGLDYFLIVNINNWFNVEFGKRTNASADGRLKKQPLANGNTPTAGYDNSGITAMLNSLAKINSNNHAGYSHNMKFSKRQFKEGRKKLEALLNTYWKKGGTQAMITAVSPGDLEEAMKHPEKYTNLIVRVGGFSARFIELRRDIQLDLLNRTLHE